MEKVYRLFNKSNEYDFFVPFISNPSEVFVKEGDKVKPGQVIYKRESHGVAKIIDLAKELDCKPNKCTDYINRIDGEYIEAGEIIAEKIELSGLVVKKVLSDVEGIINFESLDKGIVQIMSERVEMHEALSVSGIVKKIDLLKGITFTVNAKKLIPFVQSFESVISNISLYKGYNNLINYFRVIKQGDSVYTVNDLESDYRDCVVYAGRFLYPNLYKEIIARGATAVIAYSMDYDDYLSIENSKKILLIGGYGHLDINHKLLKMISQYDGKYVFVDNQDNGLYFVEENLEESSQLLEYDFISLSTLNRDSSAKDEAENGVESDLVEKNAKILLQAFEIENFAEECEFVQFVEGSEYVMVNLKPSEQRIMKRGAVEILSL